MHPDLRPLVEEVIHGMTRLGFQPTIFFGWRSVAVQLEIFKKKHTKVRFSFHNVQKKDGIPDAYVADIVDRRWAWSDAARIHGYWNAPGEEARKQKLYWGGDWDRPDWAHVQLVPNSQLRRLKRESIVTTRYSIPDVRVYAGKTVEEKKLTRLSMEAGVALLQSFEVKGSPRRNIPGADGRTLLNEFEKLVEDVKGHALTLNLLGS